jgi:hypothetical protein
VGGDPVNKLDPGGQSFWWADSLEQGFEVGIGGGGWYGSGGGWWGCYSTGFVGASFCGLQYELSGAILAVMPPPERRRLARECRQALYYAGVQTLGGALQTANHSVLGLEFRDEYDDGTYGTVMGVYVEGDSQLSMWVNVSPGAVLAGNAVVWWLRLSIDDKADVVSGEFHQSGGHTDWSVANCPINEIIHGNARSLMNGPDLVYSGPFTNSNSLVSTLLYQAGVVLPQPPNTPGWGNSLVYFPPGYTRIYPRG